MAADAVSLPLHAAEWLAINALVPSSGWAAALVRRRGLEQGRVLLLSEGDPSPSGEAEVGSAALEASEEPYRGVGPWAECAFGLFTPGKDFGHASIDDGTAPGENLTRVPDRVCVFGGILVPKLGCP